MPDASGSVGLRASRESVGRDRVVLVALPQESFAILRSGLGDSLADRFGKSGASLAARARSLIRDRDFSTAKERPLVRSEPRSTAKSTPAVPSPIADNLATWLVTERKSSGLVAPTGREWRTGFTALTEAAKIMPWPRNALRHSFGSYHYAQHKNENLTAAEMGNSPEMIFKHYRAVVLGGDEVRYWNLLNKQPKIISIVAASDKLPIGRNRKTKSAA